MQTVLIAGVGLIGGSLGKALRARGLARVLGHGRDAERLAPAVAQGVLDEVVSDFEAAAAQADVVVLGVPVGAMRELLARVAPVLRADALLMDVGSTKTSVVADAQAVWGEIPPHFVPAHPIAGGERSGYAYADERLFDDRPVVLTPSLETAPAAVERAAVFWRGVGAKVLGLTPQRHDDVLAATSHLPHVLAYALMASLAARPDAAELWQLSAGSLRDATRVALSDPALWRDICIANRGPVRAALAELRAVLEQLDAALGADDAAALEAAFAAGHRARAELHVP